MRMCRFLLKFPLFPCREIAIAQDPLQIPWPRWHRASPEAAAGKGNARQVNTFPALNTIDAMTSARRSDFDWLGLPKAARGDRTLWRDRPCATVRRRAFEQAAT